MAYVLIVQEAEMLNVDVRKLFFFFLIEDVVKIFPDH